jgi:hypothetical protein
VNVFIFEADRDDMSYTMHAQQSNMGHPTPWAVPMGCICTPSKNIRTLLPNSIWGNHVCILDANKSN